MYFVDEPEDTHEKVVSSYEWVWLPQYGTKILPRIA